MSKDILPFFTTDSTLGKSILSADDPESVNKDTGKKYFKEINESEPISVWSIAYHHNINPVYVIEDSMISFINHYKYSKSCKKQLIFGLKIRMANDSSDSSTDSFRTESNVVVFMKNGDAYTDLIKLYTAIHSDPNRYIWDKYAMNGYNRGDWQLLQKYLTKNLTLMVPFYNSFLHRNMLEFGHRSIPEFANIRPVFSIENHNLPFDALIKDAVTSYCKENKYEVINGHSIFYYKNSDVKAYQIFRCINNSTTYDNPDFPHFSSDQFSFESYLEKYQNSKS